MNIGVEVFWLIGWNIWISICNVNIEASVKRLFDLIWDLEFFEWNVFVDVWSANIQFFQW